jgi:predicted small secreted protein
VGHANVTSVLEGCNITRIQQSIRRLFLALPLLLWPISHSKAPDAACLTIEGKLPGFKDFYHIIVIHMKRHLFFSFIIIALLSAGCNWIGIHTVTGNGNIATENRSVAGFSILTA